MPQRLFPPANQRRCDAVSKHIGRTSAHIQNLVNTQQQQQTGFGNMEH